MSFVRDMHSGDVEAVATVHVNAWKSAYKGGLMPQAYLDALTVESRIGSWSEALRRPAAPGGVRLVADDGAIRGFLVGGTTNPMYRPETAEIYAINIDPHSWGGGYGKALMQEAIRRFREYGFRAAILWVHPGNTRARQFYEGLGWQWDAEEREQEVHGVVVPEVRYRWDVTT